MDKITFYGESNMITNIDPSLPTFIRSIVMKESIMLKKSIYKKHQYYCLAFFFAFLYQQTFQKSRENEVQVYMAFI